MRSSERAWLLPLVLLVAVTPARAQEPTMEERLREALRRTTAQVHALQDQVEAAQTDLAAAKAQVSALTQENTELKARPEPPPPPPPAPADDAERAALRDALNQANARNTMLQSRLTAAESLAQTRTAEAHAQATASTAAISTAQNQLNACRDTNTKLFAVAGEILDTYRSQNFRSVWLRSYEPVLGLDRVRLENIMQDFEDKLRAQQLPPATGRKP